MTRIISPLQHLGMLVLMLMLLMPQGASAATEVTPAQPAITGSLCIDGVFTPPVVTFGPTTGIQYSDVELQRDAYYADFYGLRITATLDDGSTWAPEWGEGWFLNGLDERTLTYIGGFETILCDANVVLAQPTITGNSCTDGEYTPPDVTFGPTTGVTYDDVTVTKQDNGDYAVDATARMNDGYGNGSLENGWSTFRSALDFHYDGTIDAVSCQPDASPTLVEQLVQLLIQILQELLAGGPA